MLRGRSRPWSICVIAAVLAVVGAAEAASRPPVRTLYEMRTDNVILQEWDLSCGAAALATILNFQHGDAVNERQVALGLMGRPEYVADPDLVRIRQGFSLLDLKRYVDARGYRGVGYGRMEFDDLLERAPLLVPLNLGGFNHFVVFRGMLRDRVLLADPAYGNRTIPREKFEWAWLDIPEMGKVGFVVERRDGLAPPNRLAPDPQEFVFVR
jgi:predicted double-glycine peptidase